jgi:sulfoxide reductase catalytic subunit YedY
MNIIKKPSWNLSQNDVTPQELFDKRRSFLKLGAASMVASGAIIEALAKDNIPVANLKYIKDKNIDNLKLNTYEQITTYNNFYEFTTSKGGVKDLAHTLDTNNWKIEIDGLVEKPFTLDLEDMISKMSI